MKFNIYIFDWDTEYEYERATIQCDTYSEMMKYAENLCSKVMKEHNLESVCWNYEEVKK